jgi:hypothetical protein
MHGYGTRVILAAGMALAARSAAAQSAPPEPPKPRPIARVSFYTDAATTDVDGLPSKNFGQLTAAFTYQLPPDVNEDGLDYGVDARESTYTGTDRPRTVSIYEGFVGVRLGQGRARARVGHLWLSDLGSLGSVAGAQFEYRQPQEHPSDGRIRVGAFGGLEPNVYDTGYAPDVRKYGAYVAYDGDHARRHVLGFVTLKDASMIERSVLTTTNFLPIDRVFYLYQALEYDLQSPGGQGRTGLTYFFTNVRALASSRVELQGNYNRGRSVDTRGLVQDIAGGRTLTQSQIDGLMYESAGGRATVEVVKRVRVYAGYAQDRTNRDSASTGRITIGGYAGNIRNSGFDVSASDSTLDGAGRRYHATYVQVGRQIGRALYLSGDFSSSLSVIRFSRSDGIVVEQRPQTKRVSGNAVVYATRAMSVMVTVDRTVDDTSRDLRILSGLTYRFQ